MEAKGLGSDVTVCGAFATSQLLLCVTCYLSNSWVGTKAPQLRMEVWDPYLLAVIRLFRTRPIHAQVREGRGPWMGSGPSDACLEGGARTWGRVKE